jgi:Kef-type K+ transport system membrane component KefB
MLSIVSGIIVSGGVDLLNIIIIIVLAVLFIGGVLFLGPYLLRFTIRLLCKQDCGLAARQKSNRLAIGLGMMPRGEVGLIFTAIGKSLGVINDALFSAAMLTVIVATLISHPC